MSYSLNEIEGLSKRAARGAGQSWGMAEETAKAVRWLASHGLPGAEVLVDALTQNDNGAHADVAPISTSGVWQGKHGRLCPMASGAALNDCADRLASGENIEMAGVSHPLLVVPFAAWAAIHVQAPVMVAWSGASFCTDGFSLRVEGSRTTIETNLPVSLTCEVVESFDGLLSSAAMRGDVSAAAWEALNAFAGRTYAPATEESRVLGAGAGNSDND